MKWDCVFHASPRVWSSPPLAGLSQGIRLDLNNRKTWITIREMWHFCLEQLKTNVMMTQLFSAVRHILFLPLIAPWLETALVCDAQIRGLIRPEVPLWVSAAWSGQGAKLLSHLLFVFVRSSSSFVSCLSWQFAFYVYSSSEDFLLLW